MTDLQKTELLRLLKHHYGYTAFRPGQEKAITAAVGGRNVAVVMPTGGGKSLCYQLPALVLPGVTVVVSPLIALMQDQVDSLTAVGIPAAYINSTLSPAETAQRLDEVRANGYKLLYIAPERFASREFMAALTAVTVSLFAVDEAHCISQWGHDFRPSYLRLKDVIKTIGRPPVMTLTATATPEVRDDIIAQLDLEHPELIITGFARPNLQLGVVHATEARKPSYVLDAVLSAPDQSGIIYAGTRARVESLLQYLLEQGIDAVGYHAGIEVSERQWVQQQFMGGKAKVIIATNAFGLGIDKRDIRFVIHYDMPGTVEAYYQEAGRAGRDGKPSFCLLLYNSRDRMLHEFFIKGDNPPPEMVRELYRSLLAYGSDTVLVTYAELLEGLSESVPEMAVGTGIKLLEREGYVARTREKAAVAYLKLNQPYAATLDRLGPRAKKMRETLAALHNRLGEELESGWSGTLDSAAEIAGIARDPLVRLIRKLADAGLAEYRPPFRGTEIQILKRVDASELTFDEGAMRTKLAAAFRKLDEIERYVYHFGCRQQFILSYFGESDSPRCGKCDLCLTGGGARREKFADKAERSRYRSGASWHGESADKTIEVEAPAVRPALSTKLTQLETLDLFLQKYDIPRIASERGMTEADVIDHLTYLIEKRLITNIDTLVPAKLQARIRDGAAGIDLGAARLVEALDKVVREGSRRGR